MDRVRLTVVDVATDEPAAGVRIVWVAGRTSLATDASPGSTSDAQGRVTVPRSNLSRLAARGRWLLLRRTDAETTEDGRLLLLPLVRVQVEARVPPGQTPPELPGPFIADIVPRCTEAADRDGRPLPFSTGWWTRFDLYRATTAVASADGTWVAELPWAPSLRVAGYQRGYATAVVAASLAPEAREATVRLELWRSPQLRVRVLDEQGQPMRAYGVRCSATIRFPAGAEVPLRWEVATAPQDRMAWTTAKDGTRVLTVSAGNVLLGDGDLLLDLPGVDRCTLIVAERGMATHVRTLGPADAGSTVEARLVPLEAVDRLPVVLRSEPLPKGYLLLVFDTTDPDLLVEVAIRGDESTIARGVFASGRRYRVTWASEEDPARSGYLLWDGRPTLDLDALEPAEQVDTRPR